MQSFLLPFAVHISDGLLTAPWLIGGFLVAGLAALFGAWRIREEEIPRVALLTAAFFVASSIHVKVGPGSYHLLLSGLVGVVLGRRAALAIPVGLAMQAVLLSHGGTTTIGINTCIQIGPALAAWQLFDRLRGLSLAGFGAGLVAVSVLVWVLSLVFSMSLFFASWAGNRTLGTEEIEHARAAALHPISLAVAVVLAALAVWAERRMGNAPEFPLGLFIGELSVLTAVALKCVVLIAGGEQDWQRWALVELVGHLPIAVIEGVVLGFTVGFLMRVKPELLTPSPAPPARVVEETACLAK